MRYASILVLVCATWLGCQTVNDHTFIRATGYHRFADDVQSETVARMVANGELARCGGRQSADYRRGYRQAFIDIRQGATGAVPPVPPECYWYDNYRTPEGHRRADLWFAGYAAGASAAQCWSGDARFVPSSGTPYQHRGSQYEGSHCGWESGY
ncbi:MAG: hypothetical protein R3C01_11775 [Planctomycetaceae bacterium]